MAATLDHPRTFTPFSGEIDSDAGVISGVSIIQEGPARGHGTVVDRTTLGQVKKLASSMGKVKAKYDHFSGVAATIGYYDGFKIRADKLVADLHVFDSFANREQLFEMVKKIPGHFGISILFDPEPSEFDKESETYKTRVRELYSADIVDVPAANADGIFERLVDTGSDGMAKDKDSDQPPAPQFVTVEQFNAGLKTITDSFTAAVTELKTAMSAQPDPPQAPPAPPKPTEPPAPPPEPEKFDMKALAKEVVAEIRLQHAAPPIQAATPGVQAAAQPPKSYADARKEAIGDATGWKRINKAREFDAKYPNQMSYEAQTKAA